MKFTLIFRVPASPGQLPVPLAASMDDEKDVSGQLETYKGQAKKIMRQTSTTSPTPCTIESGAFAFQCAPLPSLGGPYLPPYGVLCRVLPFCCMHSADPRLLPGKFRG
jgi:hypothetical protein